MQQEWTRAEDRQKHGRRRWDHPRRWLVWFVSGMAAVPFVVIPHEIAHYITARSLGLPDVSFHFASIHFEQGSLFWDSVWAGAWSEANAIAPRRSVLWTLLAGPLLTLITAAGGLLLIRYRTVRSPVIIAMSFFAALSFLPIFDLIEIAAIGELGRSNADERRISTLLGAPLWAGAVLYLGIATALLPGFSGVFGERRRQHPIVPLLLGYFYGLLAYSLIVGPMFIG